MQHSPFIRLALDLQIGSKIEILAQYKGKKCAGIKAIGAIKKMIVTHALEPDHCICRIQEHQVNITKTVSSQVRKNIQFLSAHISIAGIDRQIKIAFRMKLSAGRRAEQINSLNASIFFENIWQQAKVGKYGSGRFHYVLDFTSDGVIRPSAVWIRFKVFFQSSTRAMLMGEWV